MTADFEGGLISFHLLFKKKKKPTHCPPIVPQTICQKIKEENKRRGRRDWYEE